MFIRVMMFLCSKVAIHSYTLQLKKKHHYQFMFPASIHFKLTQILCITLNAVIRPVDYSTLVASNKMPAYVMI